ncbi:COP23 domain-containing protein [Scytonema sp. NUACC26]|uniref:COP23 domain-containing protein n=1 Tax=Scytonema sp. NUACC26 TaxID=3140176 RepID=UPI0034DC3F87
MLSQSLKILFASGLGLSMLVNPSTAFAQSRSGDVVVPTESGGSVRPSTGTGSSTTSTSTTRDRGTRFSCRYHNGNYTVMYNPEAFPGEYFPWATPRTLGGGWNAESRCNEIARRLESYRPDGLVELKSSVENGENTVCVTTDARPSCRIVLTVPRGQDPDVVRNGIFQNLVTADNGEQTTAVNTFTGRGGDLSNIGQIFGVKKPASSSSKAPINLKPFLAPADGGTGAKLSNGVKLPSSQSKPSGGTRLNPNKLR